LGRNNIVEHRKESFNAEFRDKIKQREREREREK